LPTLAIRTKDSALCFDAKFMADAYTISDEVGGLPDAALRGGVQVSCTIHFTCVGLSTFKLLTSSRAAIPVSGFTLRR
jgi:hypothetical protein